MSVERFLEAQKDTYDTALSEIKNDHKETHWIWFIFPQIQGLGFSAISQEYAIKDLDEAREHEVWSDAHHNWGKTCFDPNIIIWMRQIKRANIRLKAEAARSAE